MAYLLSARFAAVPLLLVATGPALWAQGDTQPPARRGSPVAVLRSGPEVGRRAPDFTLAWASKDRVGPAEARYQLSADLGKTVVLAFFSRAFTRSCTAEMRALTEQYESLFGADVVVVGISIDPPETHQRFAAHLGIPFRLLSDPDQKVAKKYGVDDGSGFIRRSVYVIGADGKVAYRNLRFDPFDPKAYSALGAAVRSTRPSR